MSVEEEKEAVWTRLCEIKVQPTPSELVYMSKRFSLKKFLGMTDAEIDEISDEANVR